MDVCSVGGCLALNFTNSINYLKSIDYRGRYRALVEMCEELGGLPADRVPHLLATAGRDPELADGIAARAVDLGESLDPIFRAVSRKETPPARELAVLNRELAQAMQHLRIRERESGLGWEWEDAAELDRPLWPVAHSAAELLVSPECSLVKVCANTACEWVFVDGTKNHSRRWCDMKVCGNREKVRRHRARSRSVP